MSVLLLLIAVAVAFIVAYHTYGRWLGSKIFEISADRLCPSHRLRDDTDYVPTKRSIVFGHHFTSIAGTGPIVGPAIAVIWGWLPALLWVVLGSIFIGAVHDFGSLVVSLRKNGRTVGEIAGDVLNTRVRLLFLSVLFLALTIILAIFGLVISAVFKQYPQAIFPCVVQVPLSLAIGVWLHRKGVNLTVPSLLALGLMYGSVIFGDVGFLHTFNQTAASWSMMTWVLVLLGYSFVASVLPVWTLLQPRDYINSLQLLTTLGLVVVGLVVAAVVGGAPPVEGAARQPLEMAAPMVRFDVADAPMIFPFLFITIACGAISGFHCLVSSGTSSKQLDNERDARFIGFGSMLTEGFLATVVILACCAGLGLSSASGASASWLQQYGTWGTSNGLSAKVSAFVDGSGNFLKAMGFPASWAIALMAVLVASFAATTLDTATRLQRYVIQELAAALFGDRRRAAPVRVRGVAGGLDGDHGLTAVPRWAWLADKYVATTIAVVIAALLAATPTAGHDWSWANAGQGGLILWPMFGATNQLMAGLAFLVIAFYLRRRGKPVWFLVLPLGFMLVMPAWAMTWQVTQWMAEDVVNWPLIGIAAATLALEAWMLVEAVLL